MGDAPTEGETKSYSQTFTGEDVARFADISGDRGRHHVEGDSRMVHGLLTATLPTKLGGDMDYVARTMTFRFREPVYVGEEITCEATIEEVTSREERHEMAVSFVCRNEKSSVVLDGETEGVIFR